jgi:hypothetical protein
MKIKSLFVAVLLAAGVVVAPANAADEASIYQKPKLTSFDFSPKEIDLRAGSQNITLEVKVSHPIGVISKTMTVNLSNVSASSRITLQTVLTRSDSPVNTKLNLVSYKGVLNIPTSMPSGVWNFSSEPVLGYSPSGLEGWYSDVFEPANFRDFVDAENSLLIRVNGELGFDKQTFVGPVFTTEKYATDNQPVTLSITPPILRVAETVDLSNYVQKRAPNIVINVQSLTLDVCSSSGSSLTFLKMGFCQYKISTPKTNDYLYKELVTGNEIKAQRFKPDIYAPTISTQTVKTFPSTIARELVFSWSELVNPNSETPSVCIANGQEIKLFSTGNCRLTYFMPATESRLASDTFIQSFKVLKEGEVEVVPTPVATPTPTPTPTPVATPTAKPVVKKTITCVKGKKTVKKTAVSPKCPAGYKLKK